MLRDPDLGWGEPLATPVTGPGPGSTGTSSERKVPCVTGTKYGSGAPSYPMAHVNTVAVYTVQMCNATPLRLATSGPESSDIPLPLRRQSNGSGQLADSVPHLCGARRHPWHHARSSVRRPAAPASALNACLGCVCGGSAITRSPPCGESRSRHAHPALGLVVTRLEQATLEPLVAVLEAQRNRQLLEERVVRQLGEPVKPGIPRSKTLAAVFAD